MRSVDGLVAMAKLSLHGVVFHVIICRLTNKSQTPQVLISAAVGTVSTQKNVIDLWWNTTFLATNGEPRLCFRTLAMFLAVHAGCDTPTVLKFKWVCEDVKLLGFELSPSNRGARVGMVCALQRPDAHASCHILSTGTASESLKFPYVPD